MNQRGGVVQPGRRLLSWCLVPPPASTGSGPETLEETFRGGPQWEEMVILAPNSFRRQPGRQRSDRSPAALCALQVIQLLSHCYLIVKGGSFLLVWFFSCALTQHYFHEIITKKKCSLRAGEEEGGVLNNQPEEALKEVEER